MKEVNLTQDFMNKGLDPTKYLGIVFPLLCLIMVLRIALMKHLKNYTKWLPICSDIDLKVNYINCNNVYK